MGIEVYRMLPRISVLRWGGGVNSTGLACEMEERGERPDFISFSDTGGEKKATYAFIAEFRAWLKSVSWPDLTIVGYETEAGDKSLYDYSIRVSELPSRAYGLGGCADKWKIRPFEKWSNHQARIKALRSVGGKPCALLGYDAGEAHRYAKRENERWTFRAPLIDWGIDRDGCIAAIKRTGLPVPPKSACYFCPSSTKAEILALSKREIANSLAMEDKARAAGKLKTVQGLGRRFSWRQFLEADEAGRALLPEAPVEPCTMCADDSDDREDS